MKLTYLASLIFVTSLVSPIIAHPGCGCQQHVSKETSEELAEGPVLADFNDLDELMDQIDNADPDQKKQLEVEPPAWYVKYFYKVATKLKLMTLYVTLHEWYTNACSWVSSTVSPQPQEEEPAAEQKE